MITHAKKHQEAGYALPTKWLGAADTFQSHVSKTHDSLMAPGWRGVWQLKSDGHVAVCSLDGVELVHLRLFGVEDQSGMDRLRAECHGLWFEEPAPSSVLVQSSGLSESAWALGLTSQRLESHCHPAIMTLNYPDAKHWTWKRFVVNRHPGTMYFRIPPGELASAEARAEWSRALGNRPDMMRRLLDGKPGAIMLGPQVAKGFNEDAHVVARVDPQPGVKVWIGHDAQWPASVIGQRVGRHIHVLASLFTENGGTQEHVQYDLKPWLSEHTPWALEDREMLEVTYDPSMDKADPSTSTQNAFHEMRRLLMGRYRAGPMHWPPRLNAVLGLMNESVGGVPRLRMDIVQAESAIEALTGGWHYAVGPDGQTLRSGESMPVKNHPHSDLGDAFCYLVCGMEGSKQERQAQRPTIAIPATGDPWGERTRQYREQVFAKTSRGW
jgi:hypothetical protein